MREVRNTLLGANLSPFEALNAPASLASQMIMVQKKNKTTKGRVSSQAHMKEFGLRKNLHCLLMKRCIVPPALTKTLDIFLQFNITGLERVKIASSTLHT